MPAGHALAVVPLNPRVHPVIVVVVLPVNWTTSAVAPVPSVATFGASLSTLASYFMVVLIEVISSVKKADGDPDLAGYIGSAILRHLLK